MKIKDFMIKKPIVLQADDTVKDLLQTMVTNRIGGVPIVDEGNHLMGVVTDGDALRHLNPKLLTGYGFMIDVFAYLREELDESLTYKSETVLKDIMKTKVYAVTENADLEEALRLLSEHSFKKIPVVNEFNEVVGIISRGDVIKKLSEQMLEKLEKTDE